MFDLNPKGVILPAGVCCTLMLLVLAGSVPAQMLHPLDTRQMVEQSDLIVVGQCVEKNVTVQDNRLIVTQYKIKPDEFWKGQGQLDEDGNVVITEPGGSLAGKSPLPIAQFTPGQSDMIPGESLLLFLDNPQPAPTAGKSLAPRKGAASGSGFKRLQNTPKVVGRGQGRFSVIRHPKNGSRYVARTNVSTVPGAPINGELSQTLLKAQGMKITTNAKGAKIAVQDDNVKLSRENIDKLSGQLDTAVRLARSEHEAKLRRTPKGADEIYSFESVDAVKAAVLRMVKETKSN